MSMLEKLTEGIRQRSLAKEGEVITQKWEATGLLEGLEKKQAQWNPATSVALQQLHSQSFAVYSVVYWHRTSCLSNQ